MHVIYKPNDNNETHFVNLKAPETSSFKKSSSTQDNIICPLSHK